MNQQFPGPNAMESIREMGETFLIQENCDYYPDLFNSKELSKEYLYDNRSFVMGSFFGGHKKAIPMVAGLVHDLLIGDMIN